MTRDEFYARKRKTTVRRPRDIHVNGGAITKSVYLIICDHAHNKEGGVCKTTIETTMHEAQTSRSSVIRAHRSLQQQGLIEPVPNKDNNRGLWFCVHIPQRCHPDTKTGVTVTQGGVTVDKMGVTVTQMGVTVNIDGCQGDTHSDEKSPENKGYCEQPDRSKASESLLKNREGERLSLSDFKLTPEHLRYGCSVGLTNEEVTADFDRWKSKSKYGDIRATPAYWDERLCKWLDGFAAKYERQPVDPDRILVEGYQTFVVPLGYTKVKKTDERGRVWGAFLWFLYRECGYPLCDYGLPGNTKPESVGLPSHFNVFSFAEYYIVKSEWPPIPQGWQFVAADDERFQKWAAFYEWRDRNYGSKLQPSLFRIGNETMRGWLFRENSQPPVWIEKDSSQWCAWDEYYRSTQNGWDRQKTDKWGHVEKSLRDRWMLHDRQINGVAHIGRWEDHEWPPTNVIELTREAA